MKIDADGVKGYWDNILNIFNTYSVRNPNIFIGCKISLPEVFWYPISFVFILIFFGKNSVPKNSGTLIL